MNSVDTKKDSFKCSTFVPRNLKLAKTNSTINN